MENVGSSENVNIVVELGRVKGHDASDGDWTGSRRYLIKKDNDPKHISSPVLMEIKNSDMGDWKYSGGICKLGKNQFSGQKIRADNIESRERMEAHRSQPPHDKRHLP